jgi:ketosteroid isomerase-like protein
MLPSALAITSSAGELRWGSIQALQDFEQAWRNGLTGADIGTSLIHIGSQWAIFEIEGTQEMIMRRIALVIALLTGLATPALAQKAAIEAANAKWVELFNKGDFAGIASLYTEDATAFPPGSAIVKGSAAIGAMWKSMAEQVGDPKITTLDVKRLGRSAAREIGTFSLKTKGSTPKEITGKYVVVWEKVGKNWKLATDIWNDGK